MLIRLDDLSGPEIRALLEEHLRHMHELSPPESVHALDLTALRAPEITFWTVWSPAQQLMGCGALKELDATHGEIKSMRTASAYRGQGVARAMLAFAPARHLYEQFGFTYCAPFADYVEDPNSVFMTRVFAA